MDFLKEEGYARTDGDICDMIGDKRSTLSMVAGGTREPTADLLLRFTDTFPISLRWLRTGEGEMIAEIDLLRQRSRRLAAENERLTVENEALRKDRGELSRRCGLQNLWIERLRAKNAALGEEIAQLKKRKPLL